jgi:hypothetical protein
VTQFGADQDVDPSAWLRRWGLNLSDHALAALLAAWIVTVTATALLVSALAVASIWDSAIYFHALRAALSSELMLGTAEPGRAVYLFALGDPAGAAATCTV